MIYMLNMEKEVKLNLIIEQLFLKDHHQCGCLIDCERTLYKVILGEVSLYEKRLELIQIVKTTRSQ
jgi:hypothetical protein